MLDSLSQQNGDQATPVSQPISTLAPKRKQSRQHRGWSTSDATAVSALACNILPFLASAAMGTVHGTKRICGLAGNALRSVFRHPTCGSRPRADRPLLEGELGEYDKRMDAVLKTALRRPDNVVRAGGDMCRLGPDAYRSSV